MSATITLPGDYLISMGSRQMTRGTGNLGTYATNGVAVTADQFGLGKLDDLVIDPAGGYMFEYVASTGKVKAYTAGGTVASTFTVQGGQAAGPALQVYPDSNSGVLGKTEAGDLTIAAATFGMTGVAAAEVGEISLAGVTFNWRAIGE